jgi:RNA polymerase-binding transcription factor DksA
MATLKQLQDNLEKLRQERKEILKQLPSEEHERFCKLPPNRPLVYCSRQKAQELVKRMEQLIVKEDDAIDAINGEKYRLKYAALVGE